MFLKTETLQYKNGPEKKRVTKTPKPVFATCLLAYFPQVRQLSQVRGVAQALFTLLLLLSSLPSPQSLFPSTHFSTTTLLSLSLWSLAIIFDYNWVRGILNPHRPRLSLVSGWLCPVSSPGLYSFMVVWRSPFPSSLTLSPS